jgi:anti-anti-sigma factor
MPEGRVTYTRCDDFHVLHYFGRVDYTLAPAIERVAGRLLEDRAAPDLLFDLSAATLLDSTNLGLIARLAERVRQHAEGRPVIVSRNDDINAVLASMGFDEIFDIVGDHPALAAAPAAGEEPITAGPPSKSELHATMLAAHRALVSLNDKDRAEFEGVVAWLEAESSQHH